MSALDDVAEAVGSVRQAIGQAAETTADAGSRAGDALGQAIALGAAATVEELTAVQHALQGLSERIAALDSDAAQILERVSGLAAKG